MNFIGATSNYYNSNIVIFGAPYDATASFRKGAKSGPSAIRKESVGIETYSVYQNKDLNDIKVHDAGDLKFIDDSQEKMVNLVESTTSSILNDRKIPVLIGGEHLVTLGAVRAAFKKFNELKIIHLDAHADLRDSYNGVKLSHACIMRRCYDLVGDNRIFQFGIRSASKDEYQFIESNKVSTDMFTVDAVKNLSLPEGTPVYLTVDMDVLDPAEFPGTGTPEAGGINFNKLLESVMWIINKFNVVAIDNTEIAPDLDKTGKSTALACKFLREELLSLQVKSVV